MTGAELHSLVDVFDGRDVVLQSADRIEHVGNEQEIHDESRAVLRPHRLLAEPLREIERGSGGLVTRRDRTHHFDELHQRNGIEEVETEHFLRSSASRGHRRDGKTRCIRSEYRIGRADLVEILPHRVLHLQIFDDRFDHDVTRGKLRKIGRERKSRHRCIALLRGHFPFFDSLRENFLNAASRFVDYGIRNFAHDRVEPRHRGDLSDSAAHKASTEDADFSDFFHLSLPCEPNSSLSRICSSASCARIITWRCPFPI